MNHQEIEQQEIIERYVRRQLTPAERQAFQEHYFDCEECFEQVQTTTRFIAGVRQTARQGALPKVATETALWWAGPFKPAIGFALALTLILAVAIGWLLFRNRQPSQPRQETAHEQPGNPSPGQNPSNEQLSSPKLANEKNERARPQNSPQAPNPESQRDLLAQNRPPSVLLESSRDATGDSALLRLPANASNAILRIETAPGISFESYQLQLFDAARRPVTTIKDVKARPNGGLAASVPARWLAPGKYRVRLFGVKGGERELLGEYDLNVIQQ